MNEKYAAPSTKKLAYCNLAFGFLVPRLIQKIRWSGKFFLCYPRTLLAQINISCSKNFHQRAVFALFRWKLLSQWTFPYAFTSSFRTKFLPKLIINNFLQHDNRISSRKSSENFSFDVFLWEENFWLAGRSETAIQDRNVRKASRYRTSKIFEWKILFVGWGILGENFIWR